MRRLRRLWPALEALPGLAAVTQEWKDRLGEDFDAGRELLRLTNRRAEAYPCPSPGGVGCPRRIVDHGNGRFVAVCNDHPKRCDRLVLTRQDIAVHELDARRLCVAIAMAFGVEPAFDEIAGLRHTYRVGDDHPEAGKRFPIYLTIQTDRASLRDVVARLCAATEPAFLLLAPTLRFVDVAMTDLLARRQARFAALADLFEKDGSGKLAANDAARALLAEFHEAVMPTKDEGSLVHFPTPADATWGDVVIQFVDGHTVSVRCKTVSGVFNYTQMGMVDRRNGNPDVQWQLLRDLAEGHGQMTWDVSAARRENKKRKQTLNQRLGAFFGIEGEAIIWDKKATNYRCRFLLVPD